MVAVVEPRLWVLNYTSPPRASPQPGPIRLRLSIGTTEGCEDKGTGGVSLTPITSKGSYIEGRNYLLAAAYVMMPSTLSTGYSQNYGVDYKTVAIGLVQFGWENSSCIMVALLVEISKEELELFSLLGPFDLDLTR